MRRASRSRRAARETERRRARAWPKWGGLLCRDALLKPHGRWEMKHTRRGSRMTAADDGAPRPQGRGGGIVAAEWVGDDEVRRRIKTSYPANSGGVPYVADGRTVAMRRRSV